MTTKRRIIRARRLGEGHGHHRTKPKCPTHQQEMVYHPESVRWACPVVNCTAITFPRVEEDGRPIVGRGSIELVYFEDEDGRKSPFLRATSNNVLVPLESIVVDEYRQGERQVLKIAFENGEIHTVNPYGARS